MMTRTLLPTCRALALALLWAVPFAAALASGARAEMATVDFLKAYDQFGDADQEYMETRLSDNYNGLTWFQESMAADDTAVGRQATRRFCAPRQVALTGNQLIEILRAAMAQDPAIQSTPYGLGLLLALEQILPCP